MRIMKILHLLLATFVIFSFPVCKEQAPENVKRIEEYDFRNGKFEFPMFPGNPPSSCAGTHSPILFANSRYEKPPERDGDAGLVVDIHSVSFADLDRDGKNEAIVRISCQPGGSALESDVVVFKLFQGKPRSLSSIGSGDR